MAAGKLSHAPAAEVIRDAPPRVQNWASAFDYFKPGRFVLFEPLALAVHDWSKPQAGASRMFEQEFLEWFSWARPATLAAVFLPLVAALFAFGVSAGAPWPTSLAIFAAGVFLWTFLEYLLHRFSFHFTPRGRIGVFFAYLIHGVHHAFPDDARRWIMPPIVSVPVTLLFALAGQLVLGAYGAPLVAGGALGYVWYDLVHYAVHRGPLKSRFGKALRSHHLKHHYSLPERRFGVSTTLWDHVFGTHR